MIFERLDDHALRVTTSCKLNLFLEVIERRPDGYHELASLFQELAWGDELRLFLEPGGTGRVRCVSGDPVLDADPGNLCVRAAHAWLRERAGGERFDLTIELEKRLPAGGGIGGGSGDGVAVLRGLQRLVGAEDTPAASYERALAIGSDCPFFLWGGTAVVRGRGEHVRPVRVPALAAEDLRFCLVLPGLHVPTGPVFQRFHAGGGRGERAAELEALVGSSDLDTLRAGFWNRLERCAQEVEPALVEVRRALDRSWRVPAAMSGSGSTYFGLFGDEGEAREAAAAAERALPGVSTRVVAAARGARS